ncbi:unnamed protein product [Paramecium primaurelia]|uniref:Ubiquitin-like protease family profile domain-containing protein n=1 Tax=Paramecium primaurelia TaxID=5886 RepID=A0A8S1NKY1_PARPR|nr:unnamed protein product [Paramecium primaurelia]
MQILAWIIGAFIILIAILVGYRLIYLIKRDIQKQEYQQNNKTHPYYQNFQSHTTSIDDSILKPQSNNKLEQQLNSQYPSNNFQQNNSVNSEYYNIPEEDHQIENNNIQIQIYHCNTQKSYGTFRDADRKDKKEIDYLSSRFQSRTKSQKILKFSNHDKVQNSMIFSKSNNYVQCQKEMEPLVSNRSQNQKLISNNSQNNSNENKNDHTIINIQNQDNNQDNDNQQCENQQEDQNKNDHVIINIFQDKNQDNDNQKYENQQDKDEKKNGHSIINIFQDNYQDDQYENKQDKNDKIGLADQRESYKSKFEFETSNLQDLEQKFDKNNQDLLNEQPSNNQNNELNISFNQFIQNQNFQISNEIEIEKIEKNNEEIDNQSQLQSQLFDLPSTDNRDQQNYKYIRVNKNKIMYVNDKDNHYTGVAFVYKVQYDTDNNPKFEIYEGSFNKGKKSGKGILYGGKSKYINYEGEWKDDQQKIDQNEQQNEVKIDIQQTEVPKKKKIIIYEDGELVQNDKNKNQNLTTFVSQPFWIKYNQQYSIKDMDILRSETSWFTSSIIDGLVQYLNIQQENYLKNFFKKDTKRYLFCPSYLYASMSKDKIENNLITYQNYILEYQPINFNLKTLFSRIYFAINKNNTHFFLIYVDLPSKSLNIVDSISKVENFYQTEIEIFQNIFQQQITSIELKSCIQQRNGYDCGPYTCLNMYKDFYDLIQNVCPQKQEIQINNPQQMRKFLFDILHNQDNK